MEIRVILTCLWLLSPVLSYNQPACGEDTDVGPHTMTCLRQLWKYNRCYPSGKMGPDNSDADRWQSLKVGEARTAMSTYSGQDCKGEKSENSPIVSLGKRATQSSIASTGDGESYSAQYAADGENNCYSLNTVPPDTQSLTGEEPAPWWEVDLQGLYVIERIKVVARDRESQWTGTYEVLVRTNQSHSSSDFELCTTSSDPDGYFACDSQLLGTHVRIRRVDQAGVNKQLGLCKVLVYGIPAECGHVNQTGPHTMACLRELWTLVGCYTSGTYGPDFRSCDRWNSWTVYDVIKDMIMLYDMRCYGADGENFSILPLGRPARQSSTPPAPEEHTEAYSASLAPAALNDCYSKDRRVPGTSQTRTDQQLDEPWWALDLGGYYNVKRVKLIAYDVSYNYVGLYNIWVGSNKTAFDDNYGICLPGGASRDQYIKCRTTTVGSQVFIERYDAPYIYKALGFCKIMFYGYPDCPHGLYGPPVCNGSCLFRCVNGTCDAQNGTCTYGCAPGRIEPDCDCPDGKWGPACVECSSGCGATCDKDTGYCSPCHPGFYGPRCEPCSPNCRNPEACDTTSGSCDECNAGYKPPTCADVCDTGTYGQDCQSTCGLGCHPVGTCNHVDGSCDCRTGFYGASCDLACGTGCEADGACDKETGNCVCRPGFKPGLCNEACDAGTYGLNCNGICSQWCDPASVCDVIDGSCECQSGYYGLSCNGTCGAGCSGNGSCDKYTGHCDCKPGFIPDRCIQECRLPMHGKNCSEPCGEGCHGGMCNPTNGECSCKAGYKPNKCTDICDKGYYGQDCGQTCKQNCADDTCDHVDGACACKPGYYSMSCDSLCSAGCSGDGSCNQLTGECVCNPGYMPGTCTQACSPGRYGYNCQDTCSAGCSDSCNPVDGVCSCRSGFYGPLCSDRCAEGCVDGGCDEEDGICTCKPGFKPDTCSETCDLGTFGAGCHGKCHCSQGHWECDRMTGECQSGECAPGWSGSNCQEAMSNGKPVVTISSVLISSTFAITYAVIL